MSATVTACPSRIASPAIPSVAATRVPGGTLVEVSASTMNS